MYRNRQCFDRLTLANGLNIPGLPTDVEVAEIICNLPIDILWTIFTRKRVRDGNSGDLSLGTEKNHLQKMVGAHGLSLPKISEERWKRIRVIVIHNLDMRQLSVKYAQYLAFHDRLDSSKIGLSRREAMKGTCAYIKAGTACSTKPSGKERKNNCWLCWACAKRFDMAMGLVRFN